MIVEELIAKLESLLQVLEREHDGEDSHARADQSLLEFIGNDRVSELHEKLAVYYS